MPLNIKEALLLLAWKLGSKIMLSTEDSKWKDCSLGIVILVDWEQMEGCYLLKIQVIGKYNVDRRCMNSCLLKIATGWMTHEEWSWINAIYWR